MQARKPDRFKFSAASDLRERQIYYDGKNVTIYSPRLGYCASFDAPPTIKETVQKARADYNVELPLADLFTWGTEKALRLGRPSASGCDGCRRGDDRRGDRIDRLFGAVELRNGERQRRQLLSMRQHLVSTAIRRHVGAIRGGELAAVSLNDLWAA